MTKARKILDEICDNISGDAKAWIRSIDKLEKKVSSLDAIIDSMEEADDNATFQLVTSLPTAASAKADVYYIMLNPTTGKYEEYKKEGSSMVKVGLIGDEVYPTLLTGPVYALMAKDQENYDVYVPSQRNWYEYDENGDPQYTLSQDDQTWVPSYSEVSSESEGYAEANPKTSGWYESDGDGGYQLTNDEDTTTNSGKKYYTMSHSYAKDYYSVSSIYAEILTTSPGYADMNPKHLDWYEKSGLTYVPTTDTSVVQDKKYYLYILNS